VKIKYSWPELQTEITLGKNTQKLNQLLYSVEERVKRLERTRRDGILLTVNKTFNNDMYMIIDDFEVITEDISTGAQSKIIKRKYEWTTFDELKNGTYSGNINIYNSKIEFI
jgi:molecular chaperone GrpE (heat shock protein)